MPWCTGCAVVARRVRYKSICNRITIHNGCESTTVAKVFAQLIGVSELLPLSDDELSFSNC